MKSGLQLTGGILVSLVLCQAGRAQDDGDLRRAVSALRSEVDSLKEKHEQIVNELRELKKMLAGSVEAPPPINPPPTVGLAGEFFRGDKTASVAIIEYGDFECQFCGTFVLETYPKIADNYIKKGKVKYFYRDLTTHPDAIQAARASHCAGEQGKFWQMHDSLFANQAALGEEDISNRAPSIGLDVREFSACLSSHKFDDQIHKSTIDAHKMGITGTPTFLFGVVEQDTNMVTIKHTFVGAYPYEFFRSEIDDLLASMKSLSKRNPSEPPVKGSP